MLKLGRVPQFKMPFLVLVFVFNFDLFKFSAAILEKGLLGKFSVSLTINARSQHADDVMNRQELCTRFL